MATRLGRRTPAAVDPDRADPALSAGQRLRILGQSDDARLLSDYRRMLSRHRTALAGCVSIGVLLALAFLFVTRGSYTSVAELDVLDPVNRKTSFNDRLPSDLTMDAEVQLLHSAAVTGAAAKTLGTTAEQVDARIAVTVPANTRELRIAYTADSRKSAVVGAQAVADAYLAVRKKDLADARDALVSGLTATQKSVGAAAETQKKKVADSPTPALAKDAKRQLDALNGSFERLGLRIEQLQKLDLTAAKQVSPVRDARGPKLVNRLVALATGLALGFLAWALLLPRLQRRRPVIRASDVRPLPGVRTALTVPPLMKATSPAARERSERVLTRLWASVVSSDRTIPRVVAVLPADTRPAARDLAVDLAASSASHGVNTALAIIGNPPWPLLQQLGLEDALGEGGSHPQGVQTIGESPLVPGLTLVSLRQRVGLPVREGLREGLARIGRSFEHIVVLAPAQGTVEHQSLAWAASVPLLVAQKRQTRVSTVAEVVGTLRATGSEPLWVILAGGSGSRKDS